MFWLIAFIALLQLLAKGAKLGACACERFGIFGMLTYFNRHGGGGPIPWLLVRHHQFAAGLHGAILPPLEVAANEGNRGRDPPLSLSPPCKSILDVLVDLRGSVGRQEGLKQRVGVLVLEDMGDIVQILPDGRKKVLPFSTPLLRQWLDPGVLWGRWRGRLLCGKCDRGRHRNRRAGLRLDIWPNGARLCLAPPPLHRPAVLWLDPGDVILPLEQTNKRL